MTDWAEIEQARAKAHAKHGDNSIEGITADDPRWLSILAEEGGETSEATLLAWNALLQARIGRVAHEQTYDATGSLRGELVDVIAVASAWLDALDGVTPIAVPGPTELMQDAIDRYHAAQVQQAEAMQDVLNQLPRLAGESAAAALEDAAGRVQPKVPTDG